MIFFYLVLDCAPDHRPVRRHRRRRHDGRLNHLHTQPGLLPVGRLLHHVHRAGRHRLHDLLGRQPRLHLHDQPNHVHRVRKRTFVSSLMHRMILLGIIR